VSLNNDQFSLLSKIGQGSKLKLDIQGI